MPRFGQDKETDHEGERDKKSGRDSDDEREKKSGRHRDDERDNKSGSEDSQSRNSSSDEREEPSTKRSQGSGSSTAHYAYLIMKPSPVKGNYIQAHSGVEVSNDEMDEGLETEYGMGKSVHYVKTGLQKELAERVASYNTHTPSMWFRHLQFNKQVDFADKADKAQKALEPKKSGLKQDSSSALYFEEMLLQPYFKKDYHANEWFVITNSTEALQSIYKALDKEHNKQTGLGVQEVEVETEQDNSTQKLKKRVNIYENKNKFIEEFNKNISASKPLFF